MGDALRSNQVHPAQVLAFHEAMPLKAFDDHPSLPGVRLFSHSREQEPTRLIGAVASLRPVRCSHAPSATVAPSESIAASASRRLR